MKPGEPLLARGRGDTAALRTVAPGGGVWWYPGMVVAGVGRLLVVPRGTGPGPPHTTVLPCFPGFFRVFQ